MGQSQISNTAATSVATWSCQVFRIVDQGTIKSGFPTHACKYHSQPSTTHTAHQPPLTASHHTHTHTQQEHRWELTQVGWFDETHPKCHIGDKISGPNSDKQTRFPRDPNGELQTDDTLQTAQSKMDKCKVLEGYSIDAWLRDGGRLRRQHHRQAHASFFLYRSLGAQHHNVRE